MIVLDSAAEAEMSRHAEIASLEDDSLRQQDAGMRLRPRHGIFYRPALDFQMLATFDACFDSVEGQVESDDVRPVDLWPGPAEHAPRPADLSADQGLDRLALRGIGALVDQDDTLAVALMDRAGPVDEDGEVQSIEPDFPKCAVLDVPYPPALAFAGGWQRVEVAWTAPVAVARDERLALQEPGFGHRNLEL